VPLFVSEGVRVLQVISIVGAALILLAYGAHQAGWMGRNTYLYHVLNAVAVEAFQVGFIILEGAWTIISLAAIVRLWRRPVVA
jgi:dolichyl-phosphate-mannose--protein O-mannosyl transferase